MLNTPKEQAEKLLQALLKGKQVEEIFTDSMRRTFLLSGHTISYWEDKFKILIPSDDLTPSVCRELDTRIMELNQEATFHYATSVAKGQMIKRGTDSAFMNKFTQLIAEYKDRNQKLPAAATLEKLASMDNDDLESAFAISEIEVKFWKSILEHLSTSRKLIENATLNTATELKHLNVKFNDSLEEQYAKKKQSI